MKRVLVISPHPDDESIGCGGSLKRHAVDGDIVNVLFLTSGEKGGHGRTEPDTVRIREREANAAARVLGIRRVEFWRERDGAVRASQRVVARLRRTIRAFRPDVVYVPHDDEMHPDHRAAGRLLRLALAGARHRPDVLLYEVWTPLQQLDEIVDISRFMTAKLRAVRAYRSQCAVVAFDTAVEGLNRYRGELHSWPGGDYAEVFARPRR